MNADIAISRLGALLVSGLAPISFILGSVAFAVRRVADELKRFNDREDKKGKP